MTAPKRPRIVVVGSANVDLTTFTDTMPRAGETLFAKRFDVGFGGKGANQAVAAALCGARAHLVACLGDDLFGAPTLANLDAFGVGRRYVRKVRGASSGVAPIFVDSKGQNRIFVVKGANDSLTPRDVDRARDLLRTADVIVLQLEIPLPTVYHAVRLAKKYSVPAILNPAPAAPIDFEEVKGVEYFVPNESEAAALTGRRVGTLDEAKACAEHLLERGFERVILTLGDRGALIATKQASELVPSYNVETVDTTGAGDAFIGSFAVFLAEGLSEIDAIKRASLYAALSTTSVGTQKSFFRRSRFEKEWKQCVRRQRNS